MISNFTLDQRIRRWQECDMTHALTCGNDSGHGLLNPVHVFDELVLQCPDCEYRQHIIPDLFYHRDYDDVMGDVEWLSRELREEG